MRAGRRATIHLVRSVRAPESQGTLQRSVAACLASILELDAAEVPQPGAEHPAPWTVWRNWLASRGLGFVPVREPARFNWPGPWLAVLEGEVAVVAYGAPPGVAWNPLGGHEAFETVDRGYVIAPADPALWTPPARTGAREQGAVEAIVIAPEAEAPGVTVPRAAAVAGRGLDGDRYFDGAGTFSDAHDRGHDLTLIEAEALEELGMITAEEARRNVVTRGIDLNALVGRRFRVGEAECVGRRLCEPCAHLQRLTHPGILRDLVHRGGLRADVVTAGRIGVGDRVEPL
jgi:MOSC domain